MVTPSDFRRMQSRLAGLLPHLEPFMYIVPMTIITEEQWPVKTNTPTACTTGNQIMFVDTFLSSLPPAKQLGLMLHEILHIARGDLTYPWVDPRLTPQSFRQLANVAQDHVIEGWIAEIGRATSATATDDMSTWNIAPNYGPEKYKKYLGWSWRAVYDDLYDQADKEGRISGGQVQPSQGKGQGKGQGEGEEGEGVDAPGEHRPDMQGDIDRAAEASEQIRNNLAGTIHARVGDIELQEAKAVVPWHDVLRQCLTDVPAKKKSTWATVNRRAFGAFDTYRMGRNGRDQGLGEVTLYIDTSGSMHGTLDRVGADIMKLLADMRPKVLNVIFYDTAILARLRVAGPDIRSFKLEAMPGGGGTAVVGAMQEQADDVKHRPHPAVIMTDGYDDYNIPLPLASRFTALVWLTYGVPVHSNVGRSITLPQ